MPKNYEDDIVSLSASLVTQGKNKFFALTMPASLLVDISAVTTRDEDPVEGFQRLLSKDRAMQIAEYINHGGAIPNSVILSAQPKAELVYTRSKRSIAFKRLAGAFLILDGQHRVWGYQFVTHELRVPVVIFKGLSRKEEAQLFIDINTKQRPVPSELLLDIKKLVDSESDVEERCGILFDRFNSDPGSPLLGLLSPAKAVRDKVSRVTFYAGLKPLLSFFGDRDLDFVYEALRSYWQAIGQSLSSGGLERFISKPVVFRALMLFFAQVALRVQDRFAGNYSAENFSYILSPALESARKQWFAESASISDLSARLSRALNDAAKL